MFSNRIAVSSELFMKARFNSVYMYHFEQKVIRQNIPRKNTPSSLVTVSSIPVPMKVKSSSDSVVCYATSKLYSGTYW